MDSEKYWENRAIEREEYWNKQSQAMVDKELANYYQASLDAIQKDIDALYGRFARDNKLDMEEARKLITGKEYKTWRYSLEEYCEKIKKTGNAGLLRELNTLAMRSRITRLDKLHANTLQELDSLGRKQLATMDGFYKKVFESQYYEGLFDMGKAGKVLAAVNKVVPDKVEAIMRNRWSGKNYSDRIWDDKQKLAQEIKQNVLTAVHRGESVDRVSKRLAERMNVSKSNAKRLVRTELNYVNNQASLESIKDAGMKYFRFIATLDKRTSAICREHDGREFSLTEASAGSNVPPLHPNCRSTIAGSFGRGLGKYGTRFARDKSGKGIHVPSDMTYEDWYNKYVEGSYHKYIEGLNDAFRKALAFGHRTGNEGLYWRDKDGNTPFPDMSGNQNSVVFSDELMEFLKNAGEGTLDCIHNHPMSSSFSGQDLCVMNAYKSIDKMLVIGHDGTKYSCSVGNGKRIRSEYILKRHDAIINGYEMTYRKLVKFGMDQNAAWKEVTHLANIDLANELGWDYERTK
ncbi:minor capsid protein [Megasphaera vaginalis (ex Srinivasan et al. 2021)]|uniref:Protein F-like protein n=1 Tax=Megasphaera vaginalis (ex Srinivasan et al. 2021) TaxID=1111454 RepID=U7UKC7_9FIRM|nr:minor capsid protein [Megasphaera vaginalis (ex Srinivasan et al. 2021)]ERT59339.1 protein F-like protein [Megasphaera vaginalis (ex Srinivasan et al. 2021)]